MDSGFWAINHVRDAPPVGENRLSHVISQKAGSLNFASDW